VKAEVEEFAYLDILPIIVGRNDLYDEMPLVGRHRSLADVLDQLAEAHRQTLLTLRLADKRAPQHAHALRNHRDVETVFFAEPIDNFFKSGVVIEREAVPESPLRRSVLVLLGRDRFGEAEEWEGKVHEAVLVIVELVLAIDELRVSDEHRVIQFTENFRPALYSSKQTRPTISEVVVAIAGMIFPAICFVVWRSAGLIA